MKEIFYRPVFFLLFVVLLPRAADADFYISKAGKALTPIVVPDNAGISEKYAAETLKKYLDDISGANFKIVSASNAKDAVPSIQIGDTPKALKHLSKFDSHKAPYDSIVIKTSDGALFLNGHRKRGAVYAVSEFLQRVLGVRQWSADRSFIPKNPDIALGNLDIFYAPRLISRRSSYLEPMLNPDFAAFMKDSRMSFKDSSVRNALSDVNAIGGHSFYRILPPKKYFSEHPEWYSYSAKKKSRVSEHGQLCLTNPDMLEEFAKNTAELISKNPEAEYIHISQNDWHGYCECENCRKFESEHGGVQAATNIYFANRLAEKIEKTYPEIKVITFAYQYTRKAPKGIVPRRNVYVELCSIECDFAHPIEADTEFGFAGDLRDWASVTDRLFVWNYATCFWNYLLPHPNMTNLASDIEFFKKNGAAGIYEQGDSQCNVGNFNRLRYWLIMRLLWDESPEQKKLEREFLYGFYGKQVGKIFEEYLDIINKCASETNYAQHCYFVDTLTWLDPESYDKCAGLMNEALKMAKSLESENPKKHAGLTENVEREKIGIDLVGVLYCTQLLELASKRGIKLKNLPDPQKTSLDIISRLKKFGTRTWRELATKKMFDAYMERLRLAGENAAEYISKRPEWRTSPHHGNGAAPAVFQENFIMQENPPKPIRIDAVPCIYVRDKSASNGWAAKLSEKSEDGRYFSIPLRDTLIKLYKASGQKGKNAKFRVSALARSDEKLPKRAWFVTTLRNLSRGTRGVSTKNVANISGSGYRQIDLGTFEIADIAAEKKNLLTYRLTILPKNFERQDAALIDSISVSIEPEP